MGDVTVWGIHAGRHAEADSQFKRDDLVAVGWSRIGDLSQLPADREAFKSAVQTAYPATKAGAVPVYGGLLYRFVHEVKEGDLFVFPSKVDREVHIGEGVGGYRYQPARRFVHACDSSTGRSPARRIMEAPGRPPEFDDNRRSPKG